MIGAGREQQGGPALALLAVDAARRARASRRSTPRSARVTTGPSSSACRRRPAGALVLAIADPHSTPVEKLVEGLGGVPLLGGFAGLGERGAARLFTNGGCVEEGAVGVVLDGLPVRPIVSQGARPIGPEMVVTAAEGNLVLELAGVPALERVQQVVAELSLTERLLLENGLLIGLVIDENRPEHGLGDFLVRGVLGADSDTGAMAIGDVPRVGPDRAPARARRGVGVARAGRAAGAGGGGAGLGRAALRVQRPRAQPVRAGRSRRRGGRAPARERRRRGLLLPGRAGTRGRAHVRARLHRQRRALVIARRG